MEAIQRGTKSFSQGLSTTYKNIAMGRWDAEKSRTETDKIEQEARDLARKIDNEAALMADPTKVRAFYKKMAAQNPKAFKYMKPYLNIPKPGKLKEPTLSQLEKKEISVGGYEAIPEDKRAGLGFTGQLGLQKKYEEDLLAIEKLKAKTTPLVPSTLGQPNAEVEALKNQILAFVPIDQRESWKLKLAEIVDIARLKKILAQAPLQFKQ